MRSGNRWRATALSLSVLLCGTACGECEKDFDCPGTKVCNVSAGQCEAFVCDDDGDCPPERACRKNRCSGRPAPPLPTVDAFVVGAPASGAVGGGETDAGGLVPLTPPD
jgi:hypothetical protein